MMKLSPAATVADFIAEDEATAAPAAESAVLREPLATEAVEGLSSLQSLYDNHQAALRNTLAGIVGREHCDDLLQEVFLRAWRSRGAFRGEAQAKTWLHRIAVNAALDFKKKKRPVLVEDFETEISPANDPEREKLLGDLIEKGLEALSLEQRSVFVLYYRSEFSVEEIAETLEIPEGTVKSRLFNGRERFVDYLRRNGVQDGI